MAKKSRRVRRQRAARRPSTSPPAETAQSPQPSAIPEEERPTTVAPAPSNVVDFKAEYGYVIDDLRSMAIIAVSMLVVLIALSFVLG